MFFKYPNWVWLAILVMAICIVYVPGLENVPMFDDDLLTNGTIFAEHGHLQEVRTRLFSYGSYTWVHNLFGDGWWKQRLVNLFVHIAVAFALLGFYREILKHIQPPLDDSGATQTMAQSYRDSPAIGLAIGFFALNPAAVYAVAYLIQRSILMAALFVVLALWSFLLALDRGRWWYFLLALVCYVLAVMSKEHAVMAPLAAVPLYIIVARPAPRKLLQLSVVGALMVSGAAAILLMQYGEVIGQPFDEYSRIYLKELAALGPDVEKQGYPLSILNQSYLFFKYGAIWLFPYTGWMSIDMRPPFPISLTSFPYLFGLLGYITVVILGSVLVLRHRDWRALIGLSMLIPAVLFSTEYLTVWVQDPFVLYRSYLWAIGLPGLIFFLLHGASRQVLIGIGIVMAGLFVWGGLDRIYSLSTAEHAWSDAIEKLPNDRHSVGRWRPYLNRGDAYLDQERMSEAAQDYVASSRLGDGGTGNFNLAAMLYAEGKYGKSLDFLEQAQRQGFELSSLYFQKGIAYSALGQPDKAYQELTLALNKNPVLPEREEILTHRGQAAMQLGRVDEAIADYKQVLAWAPGHKKAQLSLGMAYVMKKDYGHAQEIFSRLLALDQFGPLYYGRALANYGLKRKAEALADIHKAIEMEPSKPNYQEWLAKIIAMP